MSGRRRDHEFRLFEWTMSLVMIGISFNIAFDPSSVPKGGFYLLENVWLTSSVLIVVFLFAGAARLSCLYANGRWPHIGPWCRVVCSASGALVWGEMALSLFQWSAQTGYHSIGVPVYFFLAIGEIISCFRAVRDGGSN